MSDTVIEVDERRMAALRAAVSAGGAISLRDAIENAVDAWLLDLAVSQSDDQTLQRLWREGVESGDAGTLDVAALKEEARRAFGAP